MRFEIAPKKGAGPIEFGMKLDQVRELISDTPESFKRFDDDFPIDDFAQVGVQVNYDANGLVEALEFYHTAHLSINGVSLHGKSPQDVKTLFQAMGVLFEESNDGITSKELGLSFWFPDKDEEPNSAAQSILVFCAGYFD